MNKKEIAAYCLECNNKFEKKRRDQIYCSDFCRQENWFKNNPRINIKNLPKEIMDKIKPYLER